MADDEVLFSITDKNLDSGLRGVPVGTCQTSFVDPYEGVHYVGYPVEDLVDMTELGCTYENAVNYDATATVDAGNCAFTGCTDSEALNFNAIANIDDSSCQYDACPDLNGDGVVQAEDLLDFLIVWGTIYD